MSGATGFGLDELMRAIISAHEVWNRRISTARLNRWLLSAIEETPPPAVSGRRIKIRYITQAKSRPPHFVLFGNQLDELPTSYERFLINGLRKTFDLPGVPIRISKKAGEIRIRGRGKRFIAFQVRSASQKPPRSLRGRPLQNLAAAYRRR